MDRLNHEYIDILNGDGVPSEKFWALEERIYRDKKRCGVQCRVTKSEMPMILTSLLREGAIVLADLSDFSKELQETMRFFLSREVNFEEGQCDD